MSKIKENNKQNFELISKLSDLMEQKNITSLEYEITEIKLKIGFSKISFENLKTIKKAVTTKIWLKK